MWPRGFARPTQPIPPSDRSAVERFLAADPVANAFVWGRGFDSGDRAQVFVDGMPPKAVLARASPRWSGGAAILGLHAVDTAAATLVAEAIPSGPANLHLTEEWLVPVVEPRASEIRARSAWLFALDPKDFVDLQRHPVQPVGPESAHMIAKAWEPDWPSEAYVRRRIEAGHAYGISEDGELVAWALTHLETHEVSMMGFLHVKEAHRGKGYAKDVGSALIKDIVARGKTPALHVFVDNVPSLELTPQFGFHRVKRQVWAEAIFR